MPEDRQRRKVQRGGPLGECSGFGGEACDVSPQGEGLGEKEAAPPACLVGVSGAHPVCCPGPQHRWAMHVPFSVLPLL